MHDLARFPRLELAQLPTPLQPLPRLSAMLGGPTIWIKRDDCTGLALGGNKTRKLEFLLGEAQQLEAELIVTFGAVQSNHVRQTVAACALLGLPCEPILSRSVALNTANYTASGNVLLDRLMGATLHLAEPSEVQACYRALLARETRRVYAIPAGGSNPTGSLGYVLCAQEITAQAKALGIDFAAIIHATSSAGTQAGLIAGMANENKPMPVLGINVFEPDRGLIESRVLDLARAVAEKIASKPVTQAMVQLNHAHLGPGYGLPTDAMVQAVTLVARQAGLLLDPVYTGKAMAGLIAEVRAGRWGRDEHIIFLHTGGSPALFAYHETFA